MPGGNGQPAVGNAGSDEERVSTAAMLAAMELIRGMSDNPAASPGDQLMDDIQQAEIGPEELTQAFATLLYGFLHVFNDADLDMIWLVPEVVTPLTADVASFSGRVRGLTGKPCPQDVRGRVLVGVRAVPARNASEGSLVDTVLSRAVPTAGAGTGGVGGVHRDQRPSGAFSLGGEDREEHPPTRIENRTVQTAFGVQVAARSLHGPGRRAGHVGDA
jgi:hypothetical protein